MPNDRPNILFCFPDQHRPDFVAGDDDLPVRTPYLDELAARGVRFTRAHCASPLCAPSRACLASGKPYDYCRVPDNSADYPLDQPTVYQALRDSGYHVAGAGKFDLHKATLDWGLDGKRLLTDWGFSDGIDNEGKWDGVRSGAETPMGPYMAYLHERGLAAAHVKDFQQRNRQDCVHTTPLPEEAYCDNWVANNGAGLLRNFPKDRPWFLQVNFTGPHDPWDITYRMQSRWYGVEFPPPVDSTQLNAGVHSAIRRNYAAMVENIDRQMGMLIDEIDSRGELDNTVVIWSSDHGEMLGDHNCWGKSVWFQPSVGVPLVMAGPGIEQGAVSDALVQVHDLAATWLDFAGVAPLAGPDVDSRSLRPLLTGAETAGRPHLISGLRKWRMVNDGKFKFVLRIGGEPLLYDLEADPLEQRNIAGSAPDVEARLADLIIAECKEFAYGTEGDS